ncbi:MAG: VWA domain-containing protein, partial [Bradyrhizobium sp.]|nr:VWA domain-containing protein [Bradyrhizobium sp.]
MKERDAARALDRLSMMAQGAGGGTRIGESLQTFNRWHAARVLHSRSCVMIVSDGYDTGHPALLGREMAQLRRRCRRIVWLNPMLGWDGYAPEARGIKAALPHVDLYAPAHTLRSLAALEPYLARL